MKKISLLTIIVIAVGTIVYFMLQEKQNSTSDEMDYGNSSSKFRYAQEHTYGDAQLSTMFANEEQMIIDRLESKASTSLGFGRRDNHFNIRSNRNEALNQDLHMNDPRCPANLGKVEHLNTFINPKVQQQQNEVNNMNKIILLPIMLLANSCYSKKLNKGAIG